jgi:hypothetical protein
MSYLVIDKGLEEGAKYSLKLTVSIDGVTQTNDINFTANTAPANGRLTVSPDTGMEQSTNIDMRAENWEDADGDVPLFYEFKDNNRNAVFVRRAL